MASRMMSHIIKPLKYTLHWYNVYAKSHPTLTMSLTTGFTMAFGSYVCQKIKLRDETPKPRLNLKQICDYAMFGAAFTGPVLRYWWYCLDLKVFTNRQAFLRPVKMMVLDIITIRFLIIATFVYYASWLQGKTYTECNLDFKEKIGSVYYESLKVWPIATLINFYLIPLPLRVLFANAVALFWNTYMSYLVSLPVQPKDGAE